jgi:hypothetical protein
VALDCEPQKPVAWLSPTQLAKTGIRVALNSVQGSFLDKRELQIAFPDQVHREVGPDGDLWLDYVADTASPRLTAQSKLIIAPPSPTWVEVVDMPGTPETVSGDPRRARKATRWCQPSRCTST